MNSPFLLLRRFLSSPAFIFFSLALSFYFGLGSIPLFDLDEGAFTEATREMMASGNYSATYLDGEPRYDKPIFFYWIQSASVTLFGFNEWAFRLPSALAASFWAWACFSFVKEFYGKQRGLIAAAFLCNTLWVALIARSAIADALLNLFLSLTLFDIWRYFTRPDKNKGLSILLRVYLWMALGTLTKGPVAVAVPLFVSGLYLLSIRAPLSSYKVYVNPLGILLYLACVSPWLIAVYLEQGAGFFEGFILEHNLKRFSETRENHGGSLFYYVFALPLILAPLSVLLFKVFAKSPKLLRDHPSRYLLIWFAVIFTVFSFSKTQLPHYILNGCVPLIILMATSIKLLRTSYIALLIPIVFSLIFLFLPELLALGLEDAKGFNADMLDNFESAIPSYYRFCAALLLASIVVTIAIPRLTGWQRLALSGALLNLFVFTIFVKVVWNIQQKPIHDMIAYLDSQKAEHVVVAYKMHMPSFSVYRKQITPLRPPEADELVMTRTDRIRFLEDENPSLSYTKQFQSGGLVLLLASSDKE